MPPARKAATPAVELLVERSAQGEVEAWRELMAILAPEIVAMARNKPQLRSAGLARLPDDLSDVMVATLESLARDDFANLKTYLERKKDPEKSKSFDRWLSNAIGFAADQHVRDRIGRPSTRANGENAPFMPSKRDLHSRAGRLDDEPERGLLRTLGMTARLIGEEVRAAMERDFKAHETRAMELYYSEGQDFEEIARELGLENAKAADRLIRSLNARLRYRFAKE